MIKLQIQSDIKDGVIDIVRAAIYAEIKRLEIGLYKKNKQTEKIGIIKGTITFLDNSCLFFTEYLDVRYQIEKLTYSFHYQQKDGTLIFRYDNAYHKPRLSFTSHKHLPSGEIIQSDIPELNDIFEEVMEHLL